MESYTSPLKLKKSIYVVPYNPQTPKFVKFSICPSSLWFASFGFIMRMKNKNLHKRDIKRLQKNYSDDHIKNLEVYDSPFKKDYFSIDGEKVYLPKSQVNMMYDIECSYDIPIEKIQSQVIRFQLGEKSYFYDKRFLDIVNGNYKDLSFQVVGFGQFDEGLLRIKSGKIVVSFIMPMICKNVSEIEYMEKNNEYKSRY